MTIFDILLGKKKKGIRAGDSVANEKPRIEEILLAGREKAPFLPWATLMTSFGHQRWALKALAVLNGLELIVIVILARQVTKKEYWVFVKDSMGQVVQADKDSFLRGNDGRSDLEIKGFVNRFLKDVFDFNSLNVNDNIRYCLKFVDTAAQGALQDVARFRERAALAKSGYAVKIEDDIDRKDGRVPEITIVRRKPLEVMAIFTRVEIRKDGQVNLLPPLGVLLTLRFVPRSPSNPHGIMVVGAGRLSAIGGE
jgi:hypothetical protein